MVYIDLFTKDWLVDALNIILNLSAMFCNYILPALILLALIRRVTQRRLDFKTAGLAFVVCWAGYGLAALLVNYCLMPVLIHHWSASTLASFEQATATPGPFTIQSLPWYLHLQTIYGIPLLAVALAGGWLLAWYQAPRRTAIFGGLLLFAVPYAGLWLVTSLQTLYPPPGCVD
jgi:hypothetical protein